MSKQRSIIYLLIYLGALIALQFGVSRAFPTLPDSANELWFASGLLLIVLGVLVTEKHFTRPLDVVVNAITVIVVLQTIDVSQRFTLFSLAYGYAILMGALALLGFALSDEDADPGAARQQVAHALYRVTSFLGSARVMFSAMFAIALFEYILVDVETAQVMTSQEWLVLLMIMFWTSALLVEPFDRTVISPLIARLRGSPSQRIGHIARRYEPSIVMVSKTREANTPSFGSFAVLHSAGSRGEAGQVAMYLDDVDTDEGRFLRFYILGGAEAGKMPGTEVTSLAEARAHELLKDDPKAVAIHERRDAFVGTVASDSADIDVIRIRMLEGVDRRLTLAEGDLLSVDVYGKSVKYQVIGVVTDIETVAGQNRAGAKFISAQQIGEWDATRQKFVGASWVPDVNAVVFHESSTAAAIPHLGPHCFRVGVVPKSPYPVYIDFNETITHHLAIIGKTGTGKSQMAARVVEGLVADGYKVVVLEVDQKHTQSLSKRINDKLVSAATTTWTKPENEADKICLVLEEAYDFIPESTFGSQDFGQPNVSRIAQLVLKCGKHQVGFLVITQRTALVSKTILYQCNTIVALQTFDETSRNFMSAYINNKYLESMSILPRFRAIVVGKGSTCDKPILVDFEQR